MLCCTFIVCDRMMPRFQIRECQALSTLPINHINWKRWWWWWWYISIQTLKNSQARQQILTYGGSLIILACVCFPLTCQRKGCLHAQKIRLDLVLNHALFQRQWLSEEFFLLSLQAPELRVRPCEHVCHLVWPSAQSKHWSLPKLKTSTKQIWRILGFFRTSF